MSTLSFPALDVSSGIIATSTTNTTDANGRVFKQSVLDPVLQKAFSYSTFSPLIDNSFLASSVPAYNTVSTGAGAGAIPIWSPSKLFPNISSVIGAMKSHKSDINPNLLNVDPAVYPRILYDMTVQSIMNALPSTTSSYNASIKGFLTDSTTVATLVGQPICYQTLYTVGQTYNNANNNVLTPPGGMNLISAIAIAALVKDISKVDSTKECTYAPNQLYAFDAYNYFVKLCLYLKGQTTVYNYLMAYLALITNMFYMCMKFAALYAFGPNTTNTVRTSYGFRTVYSTLQASNPDTETIMSYILTLRSMLLSYEGALGYLHNGVKTTTKQVDSNNMKIKKSNSQYEHNVNALSVLREKNNRLENQKSQAVGEMITTFVILLIFCAVMIGLFLFEGFPLDSKVNGIIIVNGFIASCLLIAGIYQASTK